MANTVLSVQDTGWLTAKYNTLETTPHKQISGHWIQRSGWKSNINKAQHKVIGEQILQHHHADMHHVWYCCILLKPHALSYLQPRHLTRQEGAQLFQIPLSSDCCPASSVICEKVQSKLPWTKILHHTMTFSSATVFYEGTWIRSRQISASLLTHFATKLAISFIVRYELAHEGITYHFQLQYLLAKCHMGICVISEQ
jgi:hypothetical protein